MHRYIEIKKYYIGLKLLQNGGLLLGDESIDMTKFESFEIRRNNSLIVNKPKEKQICKRTIFMKIARP